MYLYVKLKALLSIYNKFIHFKFKKTSKIHYEDPNLKQLEKSVSDKIGLRVFIKNKKNNTGSVLFEYKDLDQLNKLIDVIKFNY